jgi:hypothetical protein
MRAKHRQLHVHVQVQVWGKDGKIEMFSKWVLHDTGFEVIINMEAGRQ